MSLRHRTNAAETVLLLSSLLRTQVGDDNNPSPLLLQLMKQGKSPEEIELSQDIALLAADIMDALGEASAKDEMKKVGPKILGLLLFAIPELQEDIDALKR